MEIYLLDNVSVSPFSLHISSVQTNDNDNKHLVVFDISCGITEVKKHDNWIFLKLSSKNHRNLLKSHLIIKNRTFD